MQFKGNGSSYSNVLSSTAQVHTIKLMRTEPEFRPVDGADKLLIIKRFPDHWAGINSLYRENDDFRLLCQEYGLATDALSKLSSSEDARLGRKRAEYEQIVRELESEILNFVDKRVT